MNITTLVEPSVEPVTVAEARTLLRVETSDEDALLSSLIATARMTVEQSTGRSLINRDLQAVTDHWPNRQRFVLPSPPLQQVLSVSIRDQTGAETVWDSENYLVETSGPAPYIALMPGAVWPSVQHGAGAIRIRYRAGYGDAPTDVPPPLAHAVLLLVAHWYENRVPVVINAAASRIPGTVDALIAGHRLRRL